jgi:phosphoribosylformylglycinamidine synthase subunit PurS
MTRFEAVVEITHLPGVADPAGATVQRALPALGWSNVSELKIAKTIRLVVETDTEAEAEAQVNEMCERVLANPVIENYVVHINELTGT